jgi:hypothetical protein
MPLSFKKLTLAGSIESGNDNTVNRWLDSRNGKLIGFELGRRGSALLESQAGILVHVPFILLITAIGISNPKSSAEGVKVGTAASGVCAG